MQDYFNPSPLDREIKVNSSLVLMTKINKDGIIEYINHAFSEISGYEEFEIIGESFDVLKHPDMPKVIYDMLKERLDVQTNIRLVNKVLSKDGRYFWLISDFETKVNENGETLAHYCHSFAAPSYAVHKIESLYKILSNIELKSLNTDTSKRYLIGFLEERNMSYDDFIGELSLNRPEYEQNYTPPIPDTSSSSNLQNPLESIEYPTRTNSNLNIKIQKPAPKKKSILKKVFGK